MKYISTRGNHEAVSASKAIVLGMVPEGGLFVPESIPQMSEDEFTALIGKSYQEIAEVVLGKYLTDYTKEDITECVNGAYNAHSFDHMDIVPLAKLDDKHYILELWHGPTAAFKDLALQLTPRLLVKGMQHLDMQKKVAILVATSGDTGKAALEGFKDVDNTEIIVFYPAYGVSKVQALQMKTTSGKNTHVVAVEGNFDDCQSAVKDIFASAEMNKWVEEHGYEFSSANSINWGRLLPQIVFYVASYLNLVRDCAIKYGDKVDYVVPTGNFGNILAAWYAKQMGLPIGRLVCASNTNKVLTDFFQSGVYDRRREFFQTNSPSMDILISSNLERFLFEITNHNGEKVAKWMDELKKDGIFTVDEATKAQMDRYIIAGFADEKATVETIAKVFKADKYLLDTHTAVGVKVCADNAGANVAVIDATASPFKFVKSVYEAIEGESDEIEELELLDKLEALSGEAVHRGLNALDKKEILHHRLCKKEEIAAQVKEILGEACTK